MLLKISHQTTYQFDNTVNYGLQQLRLTPKSSSTQNVVEWHNSVEGGIKELSYKDHHNNDVELISFNKDTKEIVIKNEGLVKIDNDNGISGYHKSPSPLWLYKKQSKRTETNASIKKLSKELKCNEPIELMHELLIKINNLLKYEINSSDPTWTAQNALEAKKGVCQDFAHLFISCARNIGYPARYVSGYLMLNHSSNQSAMHAWCEVFIDHLGWVGFDASNKICPDNNYIPVAYGFDYEDAAPIIGTRIGGNDENLNVEIKICEQ